MDADAEFEAVRKDIAEGRLSDVSVKIKAIAESSEDPFLVIKCISLQKAVGGGEALSALVGRLTSMSGKDSETDYQMASALLSLGFPSDACSIAGSDDDRSLSLRARCLMGMGRHGSALE
ncbi:MAG: hypothetical protein J5485_04575, partial [Candidatus Methanomethylophilaceae archaeon]|nr:hypothetical protein [Candidatus Methanomethylophilaceae archaeon]